MVSTPDRSAHTRYAVATAAGLVAFAAAVAFPAAAVAEPLPPVPAPAPVDPGPPPPPAPNVPVIGAPLGPGGFNVLAQNGVPAADVPGGLGAPAVDGLDRTTVLGQLAAPAAPGAGPGTVPNLNPFNNAYGLPQCEVPSAPGKCEQFDVAPGEEHADVSRREWLGRYIDLYRDGRLRGGLLGQLPQQQLGEPLPGTAPVPGTNIPPGLGQYLPDPVPPAAGAPPAPVPPPPG